MSDFVYVHDCNAVNITTTSYVELIASSPISCSNVQFFYFITTPELGLATLAIGPLSQEEDSIVCSQKVGTAIPLSVEMGSRFSLKAIGSNITTGYIIVSLLS